MNNQYPRFPGGQGFGYGPALRVHEHLGNTPLQWATFSLVLLIALTLGALIVARAAGGGRQRHFGPRMMMRGRGGPDPFDVLRMRFASGQISREEYLQATSDLAADAPTQPQPEPPAAA
jgi:hypothetical protein